MTDEENPNSTSIAPVTPAGWYTNPSTGQREWWNGSAWTAPPPKTPIAALSLVSLIAGSAAFLLGLVPVLGLLLALAALTVSIVGLIRQTRPRWMPWVGLGGGAIALIAAVAITIGLIAGGLHRAPTSADSPTPRATSEAPAPPAQVEVPNVVGMTVGEASTALFDADLFATVSGAQDSWKVTAQEPAAGSTVDEGTPVSLTAAADYSVYKKISSREFAQLAKNPDAFTGRTIIMYGHVWQFDSATGTCNFLADTGPGRKGYSYDYKVTTWITGDPCSVLDPVVEDDHVALWVTIVGAYSYDTAAGGTNTAVSVKVERVKILPHQEY